MNHACLTLVLAMAAGSVAGAEAPAVLLEQHKCSFCHSEIEAKTGPSYADIAARYKGNPEAVGIITAMVRNGVHGGGPWNMPPHPEVSVAEARKMALYILDVGK